MPHLRQNSHNATMQPSTYGTARAFFAELTFIEIRRLCKNLDPEHIPDKPIVCGSFQPGMTKIELMESCLRQPGRGFCRACYAFKDAARKKDKYVSKVGRIMLSAHAIKQDSFYITTSGIKTMLLDGPVCKQLQIMCCFYISDVSTPSRILQRASCYIVKPS